MLPLSYNFNIKLWKFFFTSKSPENMFCLGLLFERRVPGWERYRMTRLLSEVSEKRGNQSPQSYVCRSGVTSKAAWGTSYQPGTLWVTEGLTVPMATASFFQGQRVPFLQVSLPAEWSGEEWGGEGARRIFPRPSLYFLLLVWLWKKEHTGKWASQIFCPATHRQAFMLP